VSTSSSSILALHQSYFQGASEQRGRGVAHFVDRLLVREEIQKAPATVQGRLVLNAGNQDTSRDGQ
jgi:hypothetical protein